LAASNTIEVKQLSDIISYFPVCFKGKLIELQLQKQNSCFSIWSHLHDGGVAVVAGLIVTDAVWRADSDFYFGVI